MGVRGPESRRRYFAAAVLATVASAIVLVLVGRTDETFWALPGQTPRQLAQARLALSFERIDQLLRWDAVLIAVVTLTLVLWAVAPVSTRLDGSPRRWAWSLRLAVVVLALAYAYSDWQENQQLRSVARLLAGATGAAPVDVPLGLADDLGRWFAAKWLFLVAASVLALVPLGHRLPRRPGTRSRQDADVTGQSTDWGAADTMPNVGGTVPADWSPSVDRFGISVSGGGIRSASFAIGVLQQLQARGLLAKARYVTSVSGGTYATSAIEHANRSGSSTWQIDRLRRRLNYLVPTLPQGLAAVARLLLGLLINLWILYLATFVIVRPVGWLIGTSVVQDGLRLRDPYVEQVVTPNADPDVTRADTAYARDCALADPVAPSYTADPTRPPSSDGFEFSITYPDQCVRVVDATGHADHYVFAVCPARPGLVVSDDDGVRVTREPTVEPGEVQLVAGEIDGAAVTPPRAADPTCQDHQTTGGPADALPGDADTRMSDLVGLDVPDIETSAVAAPEDALLDADSVLKAPGSLAVEQVSIIDRRRPLDVDARHLWLGLGGIVVATLAWMLGGVPRLRRRGLASHRWPRRLLLGSVPALASIAALGFAVFLAMPWLAVHVAAWIDDLSRTSPTTTQLGDMSWIPSGLPPLLAWPVLAVATISRFVKQDRADVDSKRPSRRSAAALVTKAMRIAGRLAIGLLLVGLAVFSATTVLTTAALNGPFRSHAWLSREVFGWRVPWPPDLVLWTGVVLVLALVKGVFPAWSWSLGTHYREKLRWAFSGSRLDASLLGDGEDRNRAGNLDGTSAELVICCAANVLGPDRAPTGRRAVSFTASRSWIGGPEIGWLPTASYVQPLGDDRRDDVSIPSLTAVSGAAVSPAMGRSASGPIGAVFAILNVRLGSWLPHPAAVRSLAGPTGREHPVWKHNPGWPYYLREVVRRHRNESHYLYVTDGGHWENLGLVEALRRGCNHIVAISASGDGPYSHATLADAIEIARTDLGIDIEFDDVWAMRPEVGGDAPLRLPSRRQYLLQNDDNPEIGRVAPRGFTFGTFERRGAGGHAKGSILLIEATMVDRLAPDVHAYAERHHEFPDINTGDQFFDNRDFESYRMLGAHLATQALDDPDHGVDFLARLMDLPVPDPDWMVEQVAAALRSLGPSAPLSGLTASTKLEAAQVRRSLLRLERSGRATRDETGSVPPLHVGLTDSDSAKVLGALTVDRSAAELRFALGLTLGRVDGALVRLVDLGHVSVSADGRFRAVPLLMDLIRSLHADGRAIETPETRSTLNRLELDGLVTSTWTESDWRRTGWTSVPPT